MERYKKCGDEAPRVCYTQAIIAKDIANKA
jgi:hypothetical protein